MIQPVPLLDKRRLEEIEAQIFERIPYYLPQWAAGNPDDPGTALLHIFSRMMEGLIQRFNRVPEKNFIAFLDSLGIELIPPRPSRVPLTFTLSRGAAGSVVIPARFQAAGNPPQGGDPVVFETERAIAATAAPLAAVFSLDPQRDRIFDHTDELEAGEPLRLLDGARELQQHILYLGDGSLFNLTAPGALRLEIRSNAPQLLRSGAVVWQWKSDDGEEWSDFEVQGKGADFELVKPAGEIAAATVNGIESRWIRLRLAEPLRKLDALSGFSLTEVLATPGKSGLQPEAAFRNDVPLLIPPAPENGRISPFGSRPRTGDTFYLAHQEALSKPTAEVSINTELEEDLQEVPEELELSWEYWGGFGWRALQVEDATTRFSRSGAISFEVPADLQAIDVNGQESLWVRVRITAGDYGEETFSPGAQPDRSSIKPPRWTSLALSYSLPARRPETVQAFNNLEYGLWEGGRLFPFMPQQDSRAAVYLGFGGKLERSPLSLFLALREQGDPGGSGPPLEWQYSLPPAEGGQERWEVLQALDSTRSLFEPGVVEFSAPTGFAAVKRFDKTLYWIRIIDMEDRFRPPGRQSPEGGDGESPDAASGTLPAPILEGLHLNTTWAVQTESVRGEIVGSSDGLSDQRFNLARPPILEETVWVDELDALSESERLALKQEDADQVREAFDEDGALTAFQVRWLPADDLLDAGPEERVYAIDRVSGQIRFGDGEQGRIPLFGIDNISADYQTGGGSQGNLPASSIRTLRSTLPFVDSVVNPLPAGGGSDAEELERALQRGPQRIRNRGKAVTCLDFEWLALEASASVARAKCLSNFDSKGLFEANRVTVAIVPESEEPRPLPTVALRRTVEQYLLARAANVTAVHRRVRVIAAAYLEVRVEATLAPQSLDLAPQAESEAVQLLSQFLHPLTGGDRGTGWEFGRRPCLSDLYSLLESIEEVDHVEELSMTLTEVDPFGQRVKPLLIAHDGLPETPVPSHSLIFSGEHKITV